MQSFGGMMCALAREGVVAVVTGTVLYYCLASYVACFVLFRRLRLPMMWRFVMRQNAFVVTNQGLERSARWKWGCSMLCAGILLLDRVDYYLIILFVLQ